MAREIDEAWVEEAIERYRVILKPSHGRKILKNEPGSGFSPKAAYIFKKQLEEEAGLPPGSTSARATSAGSS